MRPTTNVSQMLRSARIAYMWKKGLFVYFCIRCKKHFQSRLLWIEVFCPDCFYGKKLNEEVDFYAGRLKKVQDKIEEKRLKKSG